MSANNVAIYGGLTALATFDRAELHKQVISSAQFKLFLELEPQLREVIQCFYESRYGQCLKLLEEMKDNLLLDMYLAPHINTLFSMIRTEIETRVWKWTLDFQYFYLVWGFIFQQCSYIITLSS